MGETIVSPLQEILKAGRKEYIATNNNHSIFVLDAPNAIRIKYENDQLTIGPKNVLEKLNLLDFIADNKSHIIEEIKEVEEAFREFVSAKKGTYYYAWLADAEYYKSGFDVAGIRRTKMQMEKENRESQHPTTETKTVSIDEFNRIIQGGIEKRRCKSRGEMTVLDLLENE